MRIILRSKCFILILFLILSRGISAQDKTNFNKTYTKEYSDYEALNILYTNSEPYSRFTPDMELLELRSEFSKHFLNSDGSKTALVGAGPIHYYENGKWQTISDYIFKNNTNNFKDRKYAAPYNKHKLYFPEQPGKSIVSVTPDGVFEDWEVPTMVWLDKDGNILKEIIANNTKAKVSNTEIYYENIFPSITAHIHNSTTSKKLNYYIQDATFLNQKPAGAVYLAFKESIKVPGNWILNGKTTEAYASLGNAGNVYETLLWRNKGTDIVEKMRPLYFEKKSSGSCDEPDFDKRANQPDGILEGAYLLINKGSIYNSFVLVPITWLEQTNRRFPITIDPVTNFYPCATPGTCTWPTYTANRSGNSGNWECFAGTYAGRANVFDISYGWIDDTWPFSNPYMDGYASFDIAAIPDNASITSATNWWYRYDGRTCGDAIVLKHGRVQNNTYLANNTDCNLDGSASRNNNSYYNGTGKNSTGWQSQAASTTDVTNALAGDQITMGWAYNGGDDCCTGCIFGVCTCTGNDGDYHHIYGYQNASLKPYITIDYCLPPSITAQPSGYSVCTNSTMTALSVTASGTALTYQWQVSNNTSTTNCNSFTTWQNISGATSSSYTPPRIAGTRLYRVIVTSSDCPGALPNRSVISNCVSVTVNPMNGTSTDTSIPYGTGDNPPAIQFSNCGGIVLPGSSHILNTLQPPAVGAVNNISSYNWAASGGSFTGTGSSVTWTAPLVVGNYTITLTYNTSCGSFQTTCNVEVGSPNCNYAYVSPSGVNAPDRGGPDNPYRTLSYAVSQLGGRTHIRMATGNYIDSQRVNIPSNVIIEGRFDAANGWRKINNGSTNIEFRNWTSNIAPINAPTTTQVNNDVRHLIGMASNGTSGWTLQDINVTTTAVTGQSSSGRGSSNYALWINGASNYNVIRCQFTSGSGSNGSSGTTPPGAGGAGGRGSGGLGGNGSSGGSTPSAGTAGGQGGNGGGAGGNGGSSTGSSNSCSVCVACGCNRQGDGQNGSDGAPGGPPATSYLSGDRPTATLANATYFTPSAQSDSGSNGRGGGGGGGGQGARGGRFNCGNCSGNKGGDGGQGGAAGLGGSGGYGGGGSFGVWRFNSNTGANFQQVSFSSGAAGLGGDGAAGQPADNSGRNHPNNRGVSGVCALDVCSATPGNGGNGGLASDGGRGRDGANGLSVAYVVDGVNTTPPMGSITTSPEIRVLHDKGKPCINSEIEIYKGSGTWTIPSGLTFVNDKNEQSGPSGTSYTTAQQTVKVYTTTLNAVYDLTAPANFPGFIRVASDNRPLPTITITPSSLCVGTGAAIQLNHTNAFGTQVAYEWVIFSASGNDANSPLITNTSNNPLVDVSSLPAGNYKVRYRVREICCGWSRPVYGNFTITEQPSQPNNLTKTNGSNFAQVCEGATNLSVNAATGSVGGAGTCNYEYSFQNTDGVWSNWQTAIPSVTAGAAPGFVRIKARRNCDGVACGPSNETPAVEWEVVSQPTAGSVARTSPVEQFICQGANITANVSGGNGGINSIDEMQWRIGISGGWTTYSGSITANTVGSYYFQTRRVSTGYGCNNTAWTPSPNGTQLWIVDVPPVAPTISKNPPFAEVCVGTNISANITNFGSGGAGTCEDQIRYSTNGGVTWSAWSTINPIVSTSNAGTHIIQARRKCNGGACDSTANQISWVVVEDPTISVQPLSGNICYNANYSLSVTPANGTGTFSYQWQESTTGCAGPWNNVGTNSNTYTTPRLTAPRHYRVVINSSGSDCNQVISNCVAVNINQNMSNSTWNGNIDTDWFEPYNWSNCVPGTNTIVTIPAGLSHNRYPIITTNSPLDNSGGKAKAKKVNMATVGAPPPNADLKINNGAELKVNE